MITAGLCLAVVIACESAVKDPGDLQQPPLGADEFVAERQFDGDSLVHWAGITGTVESSDSLVIFADVGQGALVEVDVTGTRTRALGRRGPGPGEHLYIQWFGACSDSTLALYDPGKNEVVLYDKYLTMVGMLRTPSKVSRMPALGCLIDERLLFGVEPGVITSLGPQKWPMTLVSLDLRKGQLDTIAELPGREMFASERYSANVQVPLGRRSLVATADQIVFAMESHGDSLSAFVRGGHRAVRLQDLPMPLPRSVLLGRAKREIIEEFPERRNQRRAEQVLAEMQFGADAPRAERIVAIDDTTLWIGLPSPLDTARLWLKYRADGQARAYVWLPSSFRPLAASHGSMAGYVRDQAGLELPRRYVLRRVP